MRLTVDLGECNFSVHRKGILGPEYELKSGDTIIATASQKPFFNKYNLVHDGKEWTFKAVGNRAQKFCLLQGDAQSGAISSERLPTG